MQKTKKEASHTSKGGKKPIKWEKLKKEYIDGASLRSLSRKYNVAVSTISTRSTKENWAVQKEIILNKVEQKTVDKKAEFEKTFIEALYELTTKTMEGIKATGKKDSKSLKEYSSILKDLRDIGVYRSKLDLKEQKARIEKLEKDSAKEVIEDKKIEVSFYDAIEEYTQ